MPTMTLATLRTNAQSMLDELVAGAANPRFWANAELNVWINEACRDIARRAEVLQSFNTSVAAVSGTSKYNLPADTIRVHRIEYVPTGSTLTYPITLSFHENLDQFWGYTQQSQSSYPSYAIIWGIPGVTAGAGAMQVQFYPVPSQAGTFNIFYYRLPVAMVLDTDTADIPIGWEDLTYIYCEYRARRKNRDPLWIECKREYEERLLQLINVTQTYHDQPGQFINSNNLPSPYYFNGWGDWA